MTKVSELVSQNVGNQILNSQTWASLIYNVKNPAYGAKGNGIADDTTAIVAAITAAAVTGGIIMFPPGTYITGNQTVPTNVTLWFANGAKLSINTGATITINGIVEAGLYQIFSGLGTVIGNLKVPCLYPQWWGAKADGATDNSAAINACIATAQANVINGTTGYEPLVRFPAGAYNISTSIIIKHGYPNRNLNIEGNGASLNAITAGMTMIKIQAVDLTGSGNTGLTRIYGLKIYGGGANSTGIYIGKVLSSDNGISGTCPSVVRDVYMENVQYGVLMSDARLWEFDNVNFSIASIPASVGFYLQSIFDGFTGDSWIRNCNIVVEVNNGRCIFMKATSVAGTSKLNGIHIDNCVLYGPGIYAQTTNANSTINDLFISNCANDAGSPGNGINLNAFANRQIADVLITSCWINGMIQGIYAFNSWGVIVTGGKISTMSNQAIKFDVSSFCKAIGVNMYDTNKTGSGGGIVHLSGAGSRNKVTNCNIFNTAYTNQFILLDAGQVKPIVTSNQKDAAGLISNGVAGVEGTDFIIAGNL